MKKIKVVIVDDEPNAVALLRNYFERYFSIEISIIGSFTESEKAYLFIKQTSEIDLVILDVNMPYMNGVEFLEAFPDRKFEAIFVTAYSNYAIKAFKNKALDYILKPIDRLEFIDSIKKVIERVQKYNQIENQKEDISNRFFICNNGVNTFIDVDDLLYLQADGSYTKIETLSDTHLVSKNLKQTFELITSNSLLKINRSFIINIKHIISFSKSYGGSVKLSNGEEIGISRRLKKQVLVVLEGGK